MGKGNPLMGMLRGKVGDVVFSRLHGEQISRAYNAQVSNPKTAGQALQRAIFATVTHTAKYLSGVVESSFDGYKNGQESRNAFIKENVAMLRQIYETEGGSNLSLNAKGNSLGAPNRYIISKGNLGYITPSILDSNDALGWPLTVEYVGEGDDSVPVVTLKKFRDLFPAVSAGSQITVVALCGLINDPTTWRWRYGRFVLSQFVTEDSIIINDSNAIPLSSIDSSKTSGFISFSDGDLDLDDISTTPLRAEITDGTPVLFLGGASNDSNANYAIAGGLIISNYDSKKGVWVHSMSEMYHRFNLDWDSVDDVLSSYKAQAKVASASDWYTEQAQAEPTNTIYSTLNQAFQGQLKANGLTAKAINFEAVNSYGPIVEGNAVFFTIEPNAGVTFNASSLQVLIGETAVTPQVTSYADGSYRYAVTVPFGTANSVSMNVTFNCDYGYGTRNVGFRTTISKVQA